MRVIATIDKGNPCERCVGWAMTLTVPEFGDFIGPAASRAVG
jgi:hypothetical protein